jgi:hypothetical protein
MSDRPTVLTCSSGQIGAKLGDRFDGGHNGTWEIVVFRDDVIYSPSVIGGAPTVVARPLSGSVPSWFEKYQNPDGTLDWCGDSVAAYLLSGTDKRQRSSRGGST